MRRPAPGLPWRWRWWAGPASAQAWSPGRRRERPGSRVRTWRRAAPARSRALLRSPRRRPPRRVRLHQRRGDRRPPSTWRSCRRRRGLRARGRGSRDGRDGSRVSPPLGPFEECEAEGLAGTTASPKLPATIVLNVAFTTRSHHKPPILRSNMPLTGPLAPLKGRPVHSARAERLRPQGARPGRCGSERALSGGDEDARESEASAEQPRNGPAMDVRRRLLDGAPPLTFAVRPLHLWRGSETPSSCHETTVTTHPAIAARPARAGCREAPGRARGCRGKPIERQIEGVPGHASRLDWTDVARSRVHAREHLPRWQNRFLATRANSGRARTL